MNQLGNFIKERRLAKEWSMRELATKSDVSLTEIHRVENGERSNPSIRVLNSIGDALGVSKEDLLSIAGYKVDNENIPLIAKVFPDLKSTEQQRVIQNIVDNIIKNELNDSQLVELNKQVDMFIQYQKCS